MLKKPILTDAPEKIGRIFKGGIPLPKSSDTIQSERTAKNRRKNKLARIARRKTRQAAEPKKKTAPRTRSLTAGEKLAREATLARKAELGIQKKRFKAAKKAALKAEQEARRNTL